MEIKQVCRTHIWETRRMGKGMVIRCARCRRGFPKVRRTGSQWLLNGSTRG